MTYLMLFGALGLFLLGMWLMTEGLKMAGGKALKHLLAKWTSTRGRGLAAGMLVTALVQASGAVTVATIGFVNAGVMTFTQSLWVIFGSNVGTTFTAWIVAIFGLKLNFELLTYPLIGIGALLQVFARRERGKAFGMSLAGFGILFLGLGELQGAFAGLADSPVVMQYLQTDSNPVLWGFLTGLVLTVLTQSSSAAIALVLTALASSLLSLEVAAAAVIGANVGTTSIAIISALGATANAKRLAMAHVLFNLMTGAVALALLPVFLRLVLFIADVGNFGSGGPVLLAIFHTLFNVLGVLLMVPLAPKLADFLQRRFRHSEATERTKFLDRNVASVPDLALRALIAQLHLMQKAIASRRIEVDLGSEASREWLNEEFAALDEVDDYLEIVSREPLPENLSQQFADGLALKHYLHNACEALESAHELYRSGVGADTWVWRELAPWLVQVSDFAGQLASGRADDAQSRWNMQLSAYKVLKNSLLRGATQGRCSLEEVDVALQIASLVRRYAEQLLHTLNRFANLDEENHSDPVEADVASPA